MLETALGMKNRFLVPLLLLAFVLLVFGSLFRILHWAGGSLLLSLSLVAIAAAVLPSLLRQLRPSGPRADRSRR